MSSGFRWNQSYSVGVGEFDDDHKRLLSLGNAVIEASSQGQAREAVTRLLDALEEESTQHFASEETMMREAGYPLLADHHDKHNRLTAELHLFIQQYEAGHLGPDQLARFLIDWVVHHIVEEDKKFQAYRESIGLGQGNPAGRNAGDSPG